MHRTGFTPLNPPKICFHNSTLPGPCPVLILLVGACLAWAHPAAAQDGGQGPGLLFAKQP